MAADEVAILVGYRKFYTVFTLCLLTARYVYKFRLSYTAFVWAIWIVIWTSPPILARALSFISGKDQDPEDHYSAVYQSHSKEHRPSSSPDIRKTANNTPYYVFHFYTVCQAFAFVNLAGPLPGPELTLATGVLKVLGWIVCLLGFYGALWSRLNLASEWRGAPEVREDHKLITSGPYRYTRHPIYTSLFFMQLGSALTTLYWFSFLELCVVIVAYTIKAVNEEKMLLIHFGDKYRSYQATTSMLVPFLL